MKKLLIASTNPGKLAEVRKIMAGLDYQIVTPADVGIDQDFDVAETGDTFEQNAVLKAQAFAKKSGLLTIADDTGLLVDALDGRPGVYSKRYGSTDQDRNQKLLTELKDIPPEKRTARFICVIALCDPITNTTQSVEGRVEGRIATSLSGDQGFGYDPVFIPDEGNGGTFAQLGTDFKNTVSHRARALEKIKAKLVQS